MLLLPSLILGLTSAPIALAANVQKAGLQLPPDASEHREAVVKIFSESWETYRKFAFGHDDVDPISQTSSDPLNGWGATIVDALSTMIVMGLDDFKEEALAFIPKIDYQTSKTADPVSVFETTIRHVGGLLSAYELTGKKNEVLVKKATEVADKLAFAWVNKTQEVPWSHIFFERNGPGSPDIADFPTSNIAEAGTLILEWGRLSEYTGNKTYIDLAMKSEQRILKNPMPLPGLPAQGIDPSDGEPVGAYITWGGGSDSYFEYLIKWARLTNTDDNTFADEWKTAVDSTIKKLLRTSTVGDHLYVADQDSQGKIRHIGSHLACFHGGNFILGGKLTNDENIVNIGLQLTDACFNTYSSTKTGIGPEAFAYISKDGGFTGSDTAVTKAQIAFYKKHGFYINADAPYYILRPEVLESNFYAWRATGDTKYLDRAKATIDSFKKFLPARNTNPKATGYTGINNVDDPSAGQMDDTASFWFAEVLKYLYLTFDDPEHISLDKFVFNTECHPLEAPPAKASYGSGSLRPPTGTFRINGGKLPAVSPLPDVPQQSPEPPQQ